MSFGLIQKDVAFTNAGIQRSINISTSTEVLSIAELTATNITATNIAVGTTQILPMDVNVDSILCRQGIKVGEVPQIIGSVNVSNGYFINGNPVSQNNTFQVDNLPSPEERSRAFVNDSLVQAFGNFGLVVQGGGTDFVPVYANGSEWLIG
jgi:hypothetical protein